jgi:hypothetical protein
MIKKKKKKKFDYQKGEKNDGKRKILVNTVDFTGPLEFSNIVWCSSQSR